MARRLSVENTFFKNREIHLCRRQDKIAGCKSVFFLQIPVEMILLNFFEHFSVKKNHKIPQKVILNEFFSCEATGKSTQSRMWCWEFCTQFKSSNYVKQLYSTTEITGRVK